MSKIYKVDDEWEFYIGELYTKILSSFNFDINTVVELAPGFRYKVAYALNKINFKGTMYIIDSSKEACDYVYNKYSQILKQAKIICINKELNEAIKEIPSSIDLFLANHPIDDMIINEYINDNHSDAFLNNEDSKKVLLDKWKELSNDFFALEKYKNITYINLIELFNKISFKMVVMNQYKSNEYFMDSDLIDSISKEVFYKLKSKFDMDDNKMKNLLNYYVKEDDIRFKDEKLLDNTQSDLNWIVGTYNKNKSKFDIPNSLFNISKECFINKKLFIRKDKLKPLYINEKLYEELFNKRFVYNDAINEIADLFSITIDETKASQEEISSEAFIDFQSDASDIALNGNKGSGRAYYFDYNYNLKGEYTPLVTSKDPEYNNGKLSISSAIHESMISNYLSYKGNGCFKTLAILDSNESYKFIYENKVLKCGTMIRVIDDYNLYRFSHRFVNKLPFNKEELINIAVLFGKMEGNKFIDRLLHGAWSVGNMSIRANMIDFDTAFYNIGRSPIWSFTNKYITNYFGYEHLGQIKVLESIINSDLNIDKVSLSELENIVISKRQEEINKRFISLMGYKEDLYLKYKDEIDNLAVKFERLSKLTFANYELFDITTCESKKCYLFDFSRFFRYYHILKNRNAILAEYLLLIVNNEASLIDSKVCDKTKDIIDSYFSDILIKDTTGYLNALLDIKKFIIEYDEVNYKILNENKFKLDEIIDSAYKINENKRYLGYQEALRFELEDENISNEKYHNIINMILNVYTSNDLTDLHIFKEGFLYTEFNNGKYHYVFKLYDNKYDLSELRLFINNNEVNVSLTKENEYVIIKSENYDFNDMKEFNDVVYVKVLINNKKIKLSPIGLELKKSYKRMGEV